MLNLNTFGTEKCQRRGCDLVKVILKSKEGSDIEICALTFPSICAPPATSIRLQQFDQLSELDLADYQHTEGTDAIDVLIGSDHYWDIVTGDIIRGEGPIAVHSKLGWLLSGPTYGDAPVISNLALQGLKLSPTQKGRDELLDSLQRFWETESLGVTEPISEELEFDTIIRFDSTEGRYVVSLPWVSLSLSSSNYNECLNRVNLLRSRLVKDKFLLQEYQSTFSQQLQSGIIEVIPKDEEGNEPNFYLPHHGVVRRDKETTKLRIVFDGSAKTKSNVSLNDCLAKGPNHTPFFFHILLRFRGFYVGLVADVEKAFHQISIEKPDRDMLRYLWFEDVVSKPDLVHFRSVWLEI